MSLTISNLNKRFGDKVIFDNFSLSLPDNGLYVICGNSGIGKTTLLRIIAGLDTDYSGTVIGGGYKNVSFAFQEYRLFPELTAVDNVLLAAFQNPTPDDEFKVKALLLEFGFSEKDISLSPGELSGGMKQRVSLARAFLKDSPILLLDEPTKELDPTLAKKVRSHIEGLASSRLVILVSHIESDDSFSEFTEIKL